MLLLIALLTLSCCCIILYQDFCYRWVSIWALLGLGGIGIWYNLYTQNTHLLVKEWGANILFISFILLLVRAYFKLNTHYEGFTDVVLGKGDILILYMFCFWFPFEHFVYFYILGIFFSLFSFLIYQKRLKSADKTVPLAGLLVIPFSIYEIYLILNHYFCTF